MRLVIGLLLTILSATAEAACERTHMPPEDPNVRPDLDGPGSFGALDSTVTLDCLAYVGYELEKGKPVAIVEDETGMKHRVTVGTRMGENFGVVKEITAESIRIRQIVQDSQGEYVEAKGPVFLRRMANK
jgi:Tfp pilus assembly protein PilP